MNNDRRHNAYAARVEVLLVSSDGGHPALQRIFAHTRWHLFTCDRVADAVTLLQSRTFGVVVCNDVLADGTWQDLLSAIEVGPNSPKVIIASMQPTARLWAAAVQAGADYVLKVPFDTAEVLRSVGEAWHRWWFALVRETKFDRQPMRVIGPQRADKGARTTMVPAKVSAAGGFV